MPCIGSRVVRADLPVRPKSLPVATNLPLRAKYLGRMEGETMNMLRHHSALPVSACAVAVLMTACTPQATKTAQAPPPAPKPTVAIVASRKPPPPLAEAIPPAPPAPEGHFVWNPGHYHWNYTAAPSGQDPGFTWLPGHFVERPYPTSVWTNGNWALQDGSWGWTPGYWQ